MGYYTANFTAMSAQLNAAPSCTILQINYNQMFSAVTALNTSINATLTAIQASYTDLENQITALTNYIATISAQQTALTALTTLPGLASSLVTTGQIIAFCQAQASILSTQGSSMNTGFVQQALWVGKELIKITNDAAALATQIATLTAQIAELPAEIIALTATATAAALKFPSCTI